MWNGTAHGPTLKHELAGLVVKEEQMWQQCSKAHWTKSGDTNSKFFHNKASQRFRRNGILGFEDSRGIMCMGDNKMSGLLEEYYQHLFTSSNPCAVEEVTQYTHWVVIDEMNRELTRDFTRAEVELALS